MISRVIIERTAPLLPREMVTRAGHLTHMQRLARLAVACAIMLALGASTTLAADAERKPRQDTLSFLNSILPSSSAAFTLYEFALIFNTSSANGINTGYASSESLSTFISADGTLTFLATPAFNTGDIVWSSKLINPTKNSWTEQGMLSFGANNISFSGTGMFVPSPVPNVACGGIAYVISGGGGAFSGASGVFVDTFRAVQGASSFLINAMGFFWVPSP